MIKWEDKKNPVPVMLYNVKNSIIMPRLVRNTAATLLSEKYKDYSPPSLYDGGDDSSSSSSGYSDSTEEFVYKKSLKDRTLHLY